MLNEGEEEGRVRARDRRKVMSESTEGVGDKASVRMVEPWGRNICRRFLSAKPGRGKGSMGRPDVRGRNSHPAEQVLLCVSSADI